MATPRRQSDAGSEEGQAYYTVDEAMHVFGRFQWFLLCYAGLAWLGDAMEVMILSYLGPSVSAYRVFSCLTEAGSSCVTNVYPFMRRICTQKLHNNSRQGVVKR